MGNSSFIIRFIDIGLIILFGFLIISDITVRSELDLSGSDEQNEVKEPKEQQLLMISLKNDGNYVIMDVRSSSVLEISENLEELKIFLESIQSSAKDQNLSVVALVEFEDAITMQEVIDVLDICDRLKIPKNLNLESVRF